MSGFLDIILSFMADLLVAERMAIAEGVECALARPSPRGARGKPPGADSRGCWSPNFLSVALGGAPPKAAELSMVPLPLWKVPSRDRPPVAN